MNSLEQKTDAETGLRRVVILGAAGFVAADLGRLLDEKGIPRRSISSKEIDLLQPDGVEKLAAAIRPEDSVVVTAALTPEKGKDVRTFMKNLVMVQHLCNFLETARCRHLIYLSSDAALDEEASLVRESTPRTGCGLYGLMHVAREQMLQFALAKPAVPLLIVRPCAIYGAADTHNSYGPNRFMRSAWRDGKITLFGNGEEQRDHISVKDVSEFLRLALVRGASGAFNLATGSAISFHELAEKIARLAPRPVTIECLPRSSPITHRHFDISLRLKAFSSYQTAPLDRGLEEMAAALRVR